MKTILITAYAINPYKGSEDGTGWNITKEIAKKFKVILITRKNNVPHLDKFFAENEDDALDNIQYFGFDLSESVMKLKKKTGSKSHVIYYYLWQYCIIGFLKKKAFTFDASMCLNFHSDSHPHFLWKLKKPCIWGPIGHHPKIPKAFILKTYGIKPYLIDRFFFMMKWTMRNLNPSFRKAVRLSEVIFVINSSIDKVIGVSKEKSIIVPAVAAVNQLVQERTGKKFTILCAGRFHFMKGFDISLESFSVFFHGLAPIDKNSVRLVMVGKGKEKELLTELAKKLKIEEVIQWIDWIPHKKMAEMYNQSDVFLFPSNEGAGMVIPEAMSFGLPVLTFDNCGPGELMGIKAWKIPYRSYKESIGEFAMKLKQLHGNRAERLQFGRALLERQRKLFTWERKGKIINEELIRITE